MSAHCRHCAGLADRPATQPERDPALEAFLAAWAERNGYELRVDHGQRRSTARLTRSNEPTT